MAHEAAIRPGFFLGALAASDLRRWRCWCSRWRSTPPACSITATCVPAGLDRVLRLIVVTPEMHRVHHSNIARETNSNFGFNFPWWDRLFGTYRAQPVKGHIGMAIGLDQFRDPDKLDFGRLLIQPFVGQVGDYPINRRGRKEDGQ